MTDVRIEAGAKPPQDARITALDGARGIALVMVMQYHFWGLSFALFNRPETLAVDKWAHKFVRLGWPSMDFFFVMSGFLITGILCDMKGRIGYFRNFYGRRLLRIVPVYTLFLLFVLFLIPVLPLDDGFVAFARVGELRDLQFWYWTYLLNLGSSVDAFGVNPPTIHIHFWTLAVEEQFYLLWPFAVLALSRTSLMRVCVMLFAGALVFRIAIVNDATFGIFNENAAFIMMPARMDTLGLGALIALAMRGPEYRTLTKVAPLVAAASGVVLTLMFIRGWGLHPHDRDVLQYGNTAIALLCASILISIVEMHPQSWTHRTLSFPLFQRLGRYSYAMYIVHLLVGFELARQFAMRGYTPTLQGSQIPFNIIFSFTATVLTFLIGWLSWRLVEERVLRLKSFFHDGRRKPGTAGVPEMPAMQTP